MQPEACLSLWPTEECAWSTWDIWRSSDLVERGILIALALMLAYTVFVVLRFLRRYYRFRQALHDFKTDGPEISRVSIEFAADLSPGIAILRGIASAAPFLGLAGACYGFLARLQDASGSRASVLAYLGRVIVDTPVPTMGGILVAIPAAFSYPLIRARLESLRSRFLSRKSDSNNLRSFQFAQTLPLRKQFRGLPAFALVAAPTLACAVMAFLGSKPYREPRGLSVLLPPNLCQPGVVDRVIVLRVTNDGGLFLNQEAEDWNGLATRLSDIYRMRRNRVLYFQAGDQVSFQTAAQAIDAVRNIRDEGGQFLGPTVGLITPQTVTEDALCHAPRWIGKHASH